MAYSMEKDFSISLNDLRENDVRAVLLTQVYNAGARRRMNIHNAIEDCKKYYPSDYTLLDVFDDLMDKVPPKSLPDVQYAYSRFMNLRTASLVTQLTREKHAAKEKEDVGLELA